MQIFGKVFEKRLEVKQSRHIRFSASDAKELTILNRAIKIDVLNDEMTLEVDTKLVESAFESMKLIGAKGVVFSINFTIPRVQDLINRQTV